MVRHGVTLALVVETAGAVLDETGLPDLSMAQLALRLGIALPSLYSHVRNLKHLRQELALAVTLELSRLMGEAIQGRAGRDAVFALGRAYRAYAVAHPGRYAMAMLARPPLDDTRHLEAARKCAEVIYGAVRGYGIAEAALTDAARILRAALHGFASIEGQTGFLLKQDLDATFELQLAALDRAFSTWPGAGK
jgi:AcrR family transcriptional regulator